MGTGTAPEEGAALAVALLEEFRARRALTLATTHHDRLKAYASTTPGIVNAAMEFDQANLRPTYRLLVGVPGTSSGIEIARRLGLPERVVEHAKASLSPESREARDLIAYLHGSRDEMEEIKRQAREELAQLEPTAASCKPNGSSARKNASPSWRRISPPRRSVSKPKSRAWQPISKIAPCAPSSKSRPAAALGKDRIRCSRRNRCRRRRDARRIASGSRRVRGAAGNPLPPEQLSPGHSVRVKGFKQAVDFPPPRWPHRGSRSGPIAHEDLARRYRRHREDDAAAKPARRALARNHRPRAAERRALAADEINVIGCTVEEATRRVDKFLDQAAIAGKPSVRIIHGHGTGALRRGLAEFLSTHPLVGTHTSRSRRPRRDGDHHRRTRQLNC